VDPLDPLGRPTGTVGEYVDDLERRAGERHRSVDPLDDPYGTGRGDFR
jgi:hypothetical protein